MKYALISAILFSAASAVMADLDYFKAPARNSVFATTDSISFRTNDVSNDYDDILKAVLYRADGSWVEDIDEWTGSDIAGDDDFEFTWDVNVGEGDYFVRVFEIERDNDDYDNDNDINRSYTFTIVTSSFDSSNTQAASYATAPQMMAKGDTKDDVKVASYSAEQEEEGVVENPKKGKKGGKKHKDAKEASAEGKKDKKKESQKKEKEAELASTEDDSKDKDKSKIASAEMRKKRSIYLA